MADANEIVGEAPTRNAPPLDGGNYEIMRRRLATHGDALGQELDALNEARKRTFGSTDLVVVSNERVRTENNCVPRDIVNVRGTLLFGYEVFVGLRRETAISDVFSLHRFIEGADGTYDLSELPLTEGGGFLADPTFQKDFADLFRYYRNAKLLRLSVTDTRLLAVFQIGATANDVKVLRWSLDASGNVVYMDARGDRDVVRSPRYGFEWNATTREAQRTGRFPHLSILDLIFVETIGGDFTIKIENNTETGEGIYSDPVEDSNQSVDDAEILYARLGSLILLKVKPFRELAYRHYVFNTRTQKALRIDAIEHGCHELPESHGIVFPGGYVLAAGEHKLFPDVVDGLEHERTVRSPNGEDVLYVYHRRVDGLYALYPYNLIQKQMQTPIVCHGASLFSDGRLVVFRSASEEPSRVHPMQVWKTPFTSAEHAASAPTDGSFLAKIGNAELVRGISDAFSIRRLVEKPDPDRATYEDIVAASARAVDAYYWLGHTEATGLRTAILEVRKTAELVIDEFEKVVAMKRRAAEAFTAAKAGLDAIVMGSRPEDMRTVDAFVQALLGLRKERGRLVSLREIRYVDLASVDALDTTAVEHFERLSKGCVEFLLGPDALAPLTAEIDLITERIASLERVVDVKPITEKLDAVNEGLALLSEVVAGLSVEDRVARSRILDAISDVFGSSNRARAMLEAHRRDLAAAEGRSE
ncbi:MAG: DNA repair ATPase, partial [Polyangiaceae bacterium]|nr:DNA repair ATPase [Polyangiaceae bacterium]